MEDFEVYEEHNEEETKQETFQEDVKAADINMSGNPETNPIKEKKPSFIRRHRNACIISGCLLVSVGGGFGGATLAYQLNKSNGSGTVLYQSVEKTNSKNNTANASSMSVKDVANEAMDSVVEIKTESVSNNEYFQQAVQSGAGSGVILSKDGYIVTNNHVIDGASKITVTTKDGKSYDAKLIGTDSSTDLAVIKIEATSLKPAVMGSSSKLEVGDTAVAIGNPLGELGGTVTSGIISALDREVTIDNQTMQLLQTNAAINPGNSGGGLFNDQGELIGIVNAKSSGSNIEGLGFAIPIDHAKDVITNLIENGYVKGRASLGVTLTLGTSNNPFSSDTSTQVYIAKVEDGKAADKAGLQAGDQILKVDDKDVENISDVKTVVNSHKAGETMKITVLRERSTKTFTVTLGEADTTSTSDNSSNQQKTPNQNR
ncbi:PDZ domain-containing protein [Erysipelotrichaceae bacterium AF15-26LB]|nr:trypsin [Erysipelotrichaceae bacterium 3_1_53]MCR0350350.1 trypsin-like peptidase domain-containing protein [[Clostridium] innocuum]RJV82990.1 PDZ domain-containing protein [Erysipelotrichaceae bacterium AF19-24AC]RJV83008.1 PDZ domain-containing protein [Erysipelotrichaceae bacterium AF15-26LB]